MWYLYLCIFIGVLLFFLWYYTRTPSNDRDWRKDQSKVATVDIKGNTVTIHNMRTRRGNSTFFTKGTYDLSKLTSLWFVKTRFSFWKSGIAHTMLSFGFGDDYLVISIEARRTKGKYISILGLLRQYTLYYTFADEEDLIKLRTHHYQEPTYLYKLNVPRSYMRKLFKVMAAAANDVAQHPQFFHSMLNNCTNRLFRHMNRAKSGIVPNGIGWLFPGYAGGMLYKAGLVQVPEQSSINRLALKSTGKFSERIRTR